MGYFTWTDAKREPRVLRNGDYAAEDKIRYDGTATVVCPDNTLIFEACYEGYGIFGGYDIYDLVVDWNKADLPQIFDEIVRRQGWGWTLAPIAKAYAMGKSGMEIRQVIADNHKKLRLYLDSADSWKRTIGIAIACGEKNVTLRYPIKITQLKQSLSYDELVPSITCQ